MQRGGFGMEFCCNKKKERGMQWNVPQCLSERILALTRKRDLPECASVLAVLSDFQNSALCWRLSYIVRPCYYYTCPVSMEPMSLNVRNTQPVLAFWVINNFVLRYLEVSMLSAVMSALKKKKIQHPLVVSQPMGSSVHLFVPTLLYAFPSFPPLSFSWSPFLEKGLCIFA